MYIYDILHMHYYSEGNVFLNFEMNQLMNQYEVKNFARKPSARKNSVFVHSSTCLMGKILF